MDWKFTQFFADQNVSEKELPKQIITSLRFDITGELLALGDQSGRLIIFSQQPEPSSKKGIIGTHYLCEFQSHVKEFDCLKSVDIEEKINCIEWIKPEKSKRFLLTCNDKTVKLWKISRKAIRTTPRGAEPRLEIPPLEEVEEAFCPSLKRSFANLHTYHINSISSSIDGERFLTSDDFRVNLWHIESPKTCFNVVDVEQPETPEVITAAQFSPSFDHSFVYATSKGVVNLVDTRVTAKSSTPTLVLEDKFPASKRNFFTDFISSLKDLCFANDGTIVTRDYLTLKVWSLAQPNKPLEVYNIYEPLKSKLDYIWENDLIYDKFTVSASADSNFLLTGLYDNTFHIVDRKNQTNTQFQLNFNKKTIAKKIPTNYFEMLPDTYDFESKTSRGAFNPKMNCLAITSKNNLFIYNGIHP